MLLVLFYLLLIVMIGLDSLLQETLLPCHRKLETVLGWLKRGGGLMKLSNVDIQVDDWTMKWWTYVFIGYFADSEQLQASGDSIVNSSSSRKLNSLINLQ